MLSIAQRCCFARVLINQELVQLENYNFRIYLSIQSTPLLYSWSERWSVTELSPAFLQMQRWDRQYKTKISLVSSHASCWEMDKLWLHIATSNQKHHMLIRTKVSEFTQAKWHSQPRKKKMWWSFRLWADWGMVVELFGLRTVSGKRN